MIFGGGIGRYFSRISKNTHLSEKNIKSNKIFFISLFFLHWSSFSPVLHKKCTLNDFKGLLQGGHIRVSLKKKIFSQLEKQNVSSNKKTNPGNRLQAGGDLTGIINTELTFLSNINTDNKK